MIRLFVDTPPLLSSSGPVKLARASSWLVVFDFYSNGVGTAPTLDVWHSLWVSLLSYCAKLSIRNMIPVLRIASPRTFEMTKMKDGIESRRKVATTIFSLVIKGSDRASYSERTESAIAWLSTDPSSVYKSWSLSPGIWHLRMTKGRSDSGCSPNSTMLLPEAIKTRF